MPTAMHPQAKFDPIPPDLDLEALVERTQNLKWVQRVSRSQIRSLGQQEFEKLVMMHVVAGGKPLVIDGWDSHLPSWLFDVDWLESTYDKKQENIRDVSKSSDIPMTMGHYLRSMKQLTNQWSPTNFRDERRQRLYMKDIDCPPEWHDALQKVIHPSLFYLNENVSSAGSKKNGDDIIQDDATAAPAGDLMSSLPEAMRAQNLMCYVGHEGTFTPAHREMCASLGQNIMVEASGDSNGEKPGSSIWFMTESKDRDVVREYFLSMLGHDIEIEKHFAQMNAWKKAPFDVYVVEQRAGDFILIPPLAAHQVWNRGTRTMKVAWNRTTAETLNLALHEALPKARLVCRDEQYKNKAIIYYTLRKYYEQLNELETSADMAQMSFLGLGQDIVRNSPRAKQLANDFKLLFALFTEVLVDEIFAFKEKDVEFLEFDSCVTCSYCRSNIFNRFLTCKHCIRPLLNGDEDAYDICMECYAMGRSCACLSGLQWCEQWPWTELVENYELWRSMIIRNDGFVDFEASPQPLEVARQRSGKRSVAQICQEAVRRRPWKDITKIEREKTPTDSEPDNGEDKPKKKNKRKKKKGEVRRCHVCCHKDYNYRIHECTNPGCTEGYCYGVLYRAFDMMPQKVMEDEQWQCPKCLGICNCAHCRRAGNTNAYTPKNTSLGHDTRPIADDRSVEALVDFRIHNLSWLKAVGEEGRSKDSKRMKRLQQQADNAKAQDASEQADADRALPEDGGLPEANGHAQEFAGGYGDQSHILGGDQTIAPSYCPEEQLHGLDGSAHDDNGPSPTMAVDEPDDSLYPDPVALSRQRIGMGYYQQDDTPDKILFDPYQAPTVESIKIGEPEVPEFVKKSIRAAKRKAKQDNEDPEFIVRRSHQKKVRVEPEQDLLQSLDPSLFAANSSAPEAVMEEQPTVPAQPDGSGAGHENHNSNGQDSATRRDTSARYFDANEPELRHAKPRASYVERDEVASEEEWEDNVSEGGVASKDGGKELVARDSQQEAIDMAADAVRAIFGGQSTPNVQPADETPAVQPSESQKPPGSAPKRRGRPPKTQAREGGASSTSKANTSSLRRSTRNAGDETASLDAGTDDDAQYATPDEEPGDEEYKVGHPVRRAPGRSRRSDAARADSVFDTDCGDAPGPDATSAKMNAPRPSRGATRGRPRGKRGRGRPRRSDVTPAHSAARDEDVEADAQDLDLDTTPASFETARSTRATRGRPAAEAERPLRSEQTGTKDVQFMSMAERMAMRGKKFKIGKRGSGGKPSRSVSTTREDGRAPSDAAADTRSQGDAPDHKERSRRASLELSQGNERESSASASSSAESISETTTTRNGESLPKKTSSGATIVRLAEVDSDGEAMSQISSSGDDSGDEDIPARPVAPRRGAASRGVARGRGRGRARGRLRYI